MQLSRACEASHGLKLCNQLNLLEARRQWVGWATMALHVSTCRGFKDLSEMLTQIS
jgi:hypothetical protein